jgi:NitT/TauT family transport system ATP-binding protein
VSELKTPPTEDTQSRANALEVERVSKFYFANDVFVHALSEISFEIREEEFVSIIGPSGCGKSTLLKILCGLDNPTAGAVSIRGQTPSEVRRLLGYVPQHDHLLPWRTVARNAALGLELRGRRGKAARKRVDEVLSLVGLEKSAQQHPGQLSGGMRKRAALARAIAYDPEFLVMDEPFGALDAQMRHVLQGELLKIWERFRQTVVFVTHDIQEAILLSDRIIVLTGSPGKVKAIETVNLRRPRDLLRDRFEPEYEALYTKLWNLIEKNLGERESE